MSLGVELIVGPDFDASLTFSLLLCGVLETEYKVHACTVRALRTQSILLARSTPATAASRPHPRPHLSFRGASHTLYRRSPISSCSTISPVFWSLRGHSICRCMSSLFCNYCLPRPHSAIHVSSYSVLSPLTLTLILSLTPPRVPFPLPAVVRDSMLFFQLPPLVPTPPLVFDALFNAETRANGVPLRQPCARVKHLYQGGKCPSGACSVQDED